jgi:hypothetical protein
MTGFRAHVTVQHLISVQPLISVPPLTAAGARSDGESHSLLWERFS